MSQTTPPVSVTATNPRLLYINGVGQTIITALTIIGSTYLLVALWRQGRGKLRVRLLLGMIFGDLLLGIGAFVPNVWVLAGGRFRPNSSGCDAFGFIYTSILFSQHIYTLMIAVATFLLLKYPLSPATYWVERNSAFAAPFAWILAFAHAGAWWAHAGWAPSGPLCYYAPRVVLDDLDSRDLVQFIPRAFVFVTIIALYSMLYKFLRRPDTIQLSSQFVSGELPHADAPERARSKGLLSAVRWRMRRMGSTDKPHGGDGHSASKIDPNAPWEQLEFVQIGGRNPFSASRSALHVSPTASISSPYDGPTPAPFDTRPASPPFLDSSRPSFTPEPLLVPHHRPSLASVFTTNTDSQTTLYGPDSHRPSESVTLVSTTPELRYHPSTTQQHHVLSPVLSQPGDSVKSDSRLDPDIELDLDTDVMRSLRVPSKGQAEEDDDTPSGQTLKEFFSDDHISRPAGHESQAERGGTSSGNGGVQPLSATAYFNRQASMLMLYFPLAYMLVFSVSLIRLIYDMIHKDVNPALQIVSAWMVLSVGLIDAVVYGLAEFMIKRKVRRKMGDRL